MLGSPAGPGGPSQRGLWPLAPAPAPTATSFSADGLSKYGVYSLFPGGPSFGSALYSHASTIGRFASGQFQQSSGNTFHTAHKVSDSLFSASGYTFGAPTPPPGSPYSPIPVTQLELLAKGFNSNIIIQQPDYPPSPKKIQEKHCDEKCCSLKPQKTCSCQLGSPIKGSKYSDTITGCSRTNPIEWSGVNVKKEPGACQVAEISTSASPIVKLEVTSPTQKNGDNGLISNSIITNGGNIPVGIAIARQRVQQEVIASPSLPPASLLTTINGGAQIKEIARISEIDPSVATGSMAASSTMGGQQGGTLLQCTDDRGTGLAAWQMGGPHSQTLTTPTLWQYPAPVPVEPMVPLPVPMPPVGFQLVRDPTTGGLLLLPTTGIEPLQQAVVWPSYPQHSSVLLPSLPPIPPPPLQLLSSASSDYLSSSTTLHQHTQTHSTRLVAVTTDAKRKIPMPIPTTTFIKIETDASMDQTKTLQAVSTIGSNTGTVFTDQNMTPLVTTHVIYQHPTNLILSQTPTGETSCRSQATSPVTCLTPPPEVHIQEEEPSACQDASNQTDTPICSEDDNTIHTISDVVGETKSKQEHVAEKSVFGHVNEYRDTKTPVPEAMEVQQPPNLEAIEDSVHHNAAIQEQVPELETAEKLEMVPPQAPDLSGLELLSNSIVEFEICRNKAEEENICESEEVLNNTTQPILTNVNIKNEIVLSKPPVDDSLGGLGLLCALAEQRIMEENEKPKLEKERSKERKKEKRKSKKHSSDEPRRKKMKSEKRHEDREHRKREKYLNEKVESDKEKRNCSCQGESYRTYKSPESEEEARKFIASKTQRICKGDWASMNAMELGMRMKLAELQRRYREKQKELNKLKPKRHSTDSSKKRSRKKSTHSSHSDRSSTPPPLLDKMDVPIEPNKDKPELLKPPTLCAMPKLEEVYKTTQSDIDSSPEKYSSSKKRKVGRPKKLMSSSGEHVATETIVAKKPKSSFVGYLLAAKEKLKLQNKAYPDATPPRYVEEPVYKPKKTKNNNHFVPNEVKSSNIRPKLRAEATVKTYTDDDNNEWETINEEDEGEVEETVDHIEIEEDKQKEFINEAIPEEEDHIVEEREETVVEDEIVEEVKPEDTRCTLTAELLDVDKLRVLTAMGGLFYAGQLNALEPPDVYSITLDGERGNRPHIMSREEILRDAIVEVAPKSTSDLRPGTRVCAYWSQQYRCLYPGSVAEPGTPDPQLDEKFVSVEFDDGDSGRIVLEDIRLLPTDYPIIEYDPNPLLSLSKRRRRASTSVSTEEKLPKIMQSIGALPPPESQKPPLELAAEKENKDSNNPNLDQYKEKKRLKKKKREKLRESLQHEVKKKKRKHKCNEEVCTHKKHHKKHRKHKKHHDKVRNEERVQVVVEEQEEVEEAEEEEFVEDVEDESSEQNDVEEPAEVEQIANLEDEVTMDDITNAIKPKKSKKIRDRQESCESTRSKMSAFLGGRLWGWQGTCYKRLKGKGRSKKSFYRTIQRENETITVGDAAVFLSSGQPERPFIGRIVAMWEYLGNMEVKVTWFYHPIETRGCPNNLVDGALFESLHMDVNDVQTISHKCEVLPVSEYTERLKDDNNDIYYLAGYYDPITNTLNMKPDIPRDPTKEQ